MNSPRKSTDNLRPIDPPESTEPEPAGQSAEDWDFLSPEDHDPLPEPGDIYGDDDFEDWLEDV